MWKQRGKTQPGGQWRKGCGPGCAVSRILLTGYLSFPEDTGEKPQLPTFTWVSKGALGLEAASQSYHVTFLLKYGQGSL